MNNSENGGAGPYHIIVAMFGLSLLYGIGYGTINIMLTGRVSNTLIWFLPLSGVIALFAWGYVRKAFKWAPFVLVGYILMMLFLLPAKVQRMVWTGLVTECRYETIYLMGYDMTTPNGSATRHYLQAGEHYLANETPFTMVSYEVLYGKDDGRKLECKRFEPYSIDIGEEASEEAPKYNVSDSEYVNWRYYRGVAKRETNVENCLWFERGKMRITLQGLYPYSTLIIARSSYTPDVVVEGIENKIVISNDIEEWVQKSKDVIDTYYKALGKRAIP